MNLRNKLKSLLSPRKSQEEKTAEMIEDFKHHSAEDQVKPKRDLSEYVIQKSDRNHLKAMIEDEPSQSYNKNVFVFHYRPGANTANVCGSIDDACYTDKESAVDCPDCLKEIRNFKRLTDPHFKEDEDFIRPTDFPSDLINEIGNNNPWIHTGIKSPENWTLVDLRFHQSEPFIGHYDEITDQYYRNEEGLSNKVRVTHWRSRDKPEYLKRLDAERDKQIFAVLDPPTPRDYNPNLRELPEGDPSNPLNFRIIEVGKPELEETFENIPERIKQVRESLEEKRLFTGGDEIPGPFKYERDDLLERVIGLIENLRHETDSLPDHYYKWMDDLLNRHDGLNPETENPTDPRATKKNFEKTTDFPIPTVIKTPESTSFLFEKDPISSKEYKNTSKEILDQLDKLKSLVLQLQGGVATKLFKPLKNQVIKVEKLIKERLKESESGTQKDVYKNANARPDKLVDKFNALGSLIAIEFPKQIREGEDPFDTAIRILSGGEPPILGGEVPFQAPEYLFNSRITGELEREFIRDQIIKVLAWETSSGLRIVRMIDNGNYHLMISHPSRIPTRSEVLWARYEFIKDADNMGEILNGSDQDSKTIHLWEIRKG